MPASSVDTFFACSLMVILIVSAMAGTAKVVQPYLNNLANDGVERYRGLSEYLLSNPGEPSDWGKSGDTAPSAFGLTSERRQAYVLDADKISRLHSDNVYSITYPEILAALGIKDISLNIKIRTLFDISINLTSSQGNEDDTTYTFQISTIKSGYPISTWLQCYIVLETHIHDISSSTDSEGLSFLNVTLPNSMNGTALLVVFAKAEAHAQVMAFNAYSFSHNSEEPQPNKTFLQLSPLNHTLNVSFQHTALEISNAYVFTYSYHLNLQQTAGGNQTVEFSIPRLLEASPMILVLNGNNNSSTSFSEWTTYPQLPLEIGPNFEDLTTRSKTTALTYIVSLNSVLYEMILTYRSVQNFDA